MDFVRTNYCFGQPYGCLILNMATIEGREFSDILRKIPENADPDSIIPMVVAFLEYYRPEYKDMILIGMNFDILKNQWQFGIAHNNLPRVPLGSIGTDVNLCSLSEYNVDKSEVVYVHK